MDDFLRGRTSGASTGHPSSLSTKDYFDLFFRHLYATPEKKKVRVFARWINLEARKILLKFGPGDLFSRFQEAVNKGMVEVEYVFFLLSPASAKLPDVQLILNRYCEFASEIRLHFLEGTRFNVEETGATISIWDGFDYSFTHDWDYSGNVYRLTEWRDESDKARLLQTYERIRAESEIYFTRS